MRKAPNNTALDKAREILEQESQRRMKEFIDEYTALCAKFGLQIAVTDSQIVVPASAIKMQIVPYVLPSKQP